MTQTPLVSVIIPAYRCEKTIIGAVDSALAQDIPLEVLIIDDNPDAPIDHALNRYCRDSRISILRNERNLGAAESRNRGVLAAKAPFIAFLDADDIWLPGKIQKQLQVMERTNTVMCCTARELISPEGISTGKVIPVKENISYQELLKHNCINCSSVLIRSEIAREFPMIHEDSHEDYIMWLRVLRKYGNASGINEPLLLYRLSNSGKSGNKLKSAKMTFMAYRYMGFGLIKSMVCFCSYAFHGVLKYLFTKRKRHEA